MTLQERLAAMSDIQNNQMQQNLFGKLQKLEL